MSAGPEDARADATNDRDGPLRSGSACRRFRAITETGEADAPAQGGFVTLRGEGNRARHPLSEIAKGANMPPSIASERSAAPSRT